MSSGVTTSTACISTIIFTRTRFRKTACALNFPTIITGRNTRRQAENLRAMIGGAKNVNDFIESVGREVKKIKPEIMYGISPFGVAEENYKNLYADAEKWLRDGDG
jgi:hypothetical protein